MSTQDSRPRPSRAPLHGAVLRAILWMEDTHRTALSMWPSPPFLRVVDPYAGQTLATPQPWFFPSSPCPCPCRHCWSGGRNLLRSLFRPASLFGAPGFLGKAVPCTPFSSGRSFHSSNIHTPPMVLGSGKETIPRGRSASRPPRHWARIGVHLLLGIGVRSAGYVEQARSEG